MKNKYASLRQIEVYDLPKNPDKNIVYRLLPKNVDEEYYWNRVDRNIGWISKEEQEMLRSMTIGIAGCGGMGGLLGQIFVRLGIGEVRIADIEDFDASNINRQFGATRGTIGKSKAFVTAEKIRETSDDTTLVLYPQGIVEETIGHFLDGCDVVCDEIEGFAVGARLLLHVMARKYGITLFNCDTVGHRTYIFKFTSDSMPLEVPLGFGYGEARMLEEKIRQDEATPQEKRKIMEGMFRAFVPEIPEYLPDAAEGTVDALWRRFFEGTIPIIATNPPMATGFMANRILLHLLIVNGQKRNIVDIPKMPGYLGFDAAMMKTWIVADKWW